MSRVLAMFMLLIYGVVALAEERTERFDKDPNWDSHNNRMVKPREIRQDFGFSNTSNAGGRPGEMGGFITPAADPAYYAKKIGTKTFADPLTASGSIRCDGKNFHALIGFFNADTLNAWRIPNAISLRISGRGDVFYAWLEYATSRWRAGGDDPVSFPMARDSQSGRMKFKGFPLNIVHRWTLTYDPNGNNGHGVVTATIGDVKAICNVAEGHKADGATFNRFGLLNVMKSADSGGEVWLDDMTINGEPENFARDPGWDGHQNRRTYMTKVIRPQFDFGYSPTQHAGGTMKGELGGLLFRGDCRYPDRMAFYGDRLDELTLEKPIRASGKVCMTRGVTDSSVLFGFFHAEISMKVNPSQSDGLPMSFLGISTDGPSREGFFFSPAYRINGDGHGYAATNPPRIYPDGKPHDWSFTYTTSDNGGEIVLTLDQQTVRLPVNKEHRALGARFNRFGLITTWIDGNGQTIYFDDLTYTCGQN